MRKLFLALVAGNFAITSTALAASSGFVSINSCSSGGVMITSTTISWLSAGGEGIGCIATNTGTNVTYSGGGPLLAANTSGQIKSIPAASNLDFMIWTNQPNLHFDLITLGPGTSNTACSSDVSPNAPVCSVNLSSPLLLRGTGTGTAVTISANGIVRDGSSATSTWMGDFTTQFPGVTPAQLQSAIVSGISIPGYCAAGACTNSYSGSFVVRTTAATACPAQLGFWKNAKKHPFPVSVQSAGGLTIGGVFYTVCDLYTIMGNNANDAVAALGRQMVAAMLNMAAGAMPNASADAAISDAQDRLRSNGLSLLTSEISSSSVLGMQLAADTAIFTAYNNANFGSCSESTGLQLGASSNQCP
jgi:hypothetical protein